MEGVIRIRLLVTRLAEAACSSQRETSTASGHLRSLFGHALRGTIELRVREPFLPESKLSL